jgi:hypothetical protein
MKWSRSILSNRVDSLSQDLLSAISRRCFHSCARVRRLYDAHTTNRPIRKSDTLYNPCIFLEEMKSTKYLDPYARQPDREPHLGFLEYEARLLITQPRSLLTVLLYVLPRKSEGPG